MIVAILSLTLLGAAFGILLGIANKFLRVEGNPVVEELLALMPGSNCGQCGFPGCSGAAEAIVDGSAAPTCCPPGFCAAKAQACPPSRNSTWCATSPSFPSAITG